ncbi:hypothetical protein IMZ11_11135 [Microtetraspora sp. AC03309]|uniref:hypothetical protein n=1 Tax=Microtetraspora sp. AC03309 TaxID=2779376 RepID=UPI001E35C978|nr:hypothetical protein [Microtetraspora sp. AC03309]MCC5576187.1 hypothetical protein [Microtetraspora sp. AC03309]
MKSLEERVAAVEDAVVRAQYTADAANLAVSGIWREMTDFRRETVRRFDAVDLRLDAVDARFDTVDERFDAVDARFQAVDERFKSVDERFDGVDRRFDAMDVRLDRLEGNQKASSAMLQLILDEVRKR